MFPQPSPMNGFDLLAPFIWGFAIEWCYRPYQEDMDFSCIFTVASKIGLHLQVHLQDLGLRLHNCKCTWWRNFGSCALIRMLHSIRCTIRQPIPDTFAWCTTKVENFAATWGVICLHAHDVRGIVADLSSWLVDYIIISSLFEWAGSSNTPTPSQYSKGMRKALHTLALYRGWIARDLYHEIWLCSDYYLARLPIIKFSIWRPSTTQPYGKILWVCHHNRHHCQNHYVKQCHERLINRQHVEN